MKFIIKDDVVLFASNDGLLAAHIRISATSLQLLGFLNSLSGS